MKKILSFFVCVVGLGLYACTGGERPISREELPATARQFIMQHLEGVPVAHMLEETDVLTKSYEVWFVSGDKIEFTKDGSWTDVDFKYSAVPQSILPLMIANYLKTTFPDALVKKIERNKRGYEVSLNNGMEVDFDKQFKPVKWDK